jgi:hypothetical protein
MTRLHRWNDSELREARNVLRGDDLRVLDTRAMVCRWNGLERCRNRIERNSIAAVADRVRIHLKPASEAELGNLPQVSGLTYEQSNVARVVRVSREERRAA